jgi:hypothetical protein
MAPLIGLLSLLCGIWFLLGMPVVSAVFALEYRRSRRRLTSLLVAVVMLVVFYVSAGLIWRLGTTDWHLSFLATLEAAGDAEKYGHPVEHWAELMVVWLMLGSTLAAAIAGLFTAVARRSWTAFRSKVRSRHLQK